MNKYHQEILGELRLKSKRKEPFVSGSSYSGSTHPRFGLTVPETRPISKAWATHNKSLTSDEFKKLLDSLYRGASLDEKKIASQLLEYLPDLRKHIQPELLDNWIEQLRGWEEIDSLCQNVFSAEEMLESWDEWEKWLRKFSKDKNAQKRRASLVLLAGPVRSSADSRLANLAFENIDSLKSEKDILVTKAISWLLRDLIKNHREQIEEYIKTNRELLPKPAVREVENKLRSGHKSGH